MASSSSTSDDDTHQDKSPSEDAVMNEEALDELVPQIKDYQLTHGFLLKLVRLEEPTFAPGKTVPVSILPTPFPKNIFEQALDVQDAMSELYMRVASDPTWLHKVLRPVIEHDEFVKTLWQIWLQVEEAGVVPDVVCGIFRSDYMLNQRSASEPATLKQVEMNTFSVAGACHAERAADMHHHLKRVRDITIMRQRRRKLSSVHGLEEQTEGELPVNDSMLALTTALKAAHDAYNPSSSDPTCVLMIVQDDNFNVADERPIEYGLWDEGIPCFRCIWTDVLSHTTISKDDRVLLYHPSGEQGAVWQVSVIYYRAGYEAHEYLTRAGIETRTRLEMSRAIKCPDILTHLTTFKFVQAALSKPETLAHLDLSIEQQTPLLSAFMPMIPLSSPAARSALQSPEDWILKPNLEGGGGHNVCGSDIPSFLSTLPPAEHANYTLMRRIAPPVDTKGVLMLAEGVYQGPVVSELGVVGTCLWRRRRTGGGEQRVEKVLRRETVGWTFKTKPAGMEEMNVVKGFGCFDCLLLV